MKKIIMFFCLMMVFVGCGKKEVNPLWKNFWGSATAEVNGKMWNASGCEAGTSKDSIGISLRVLDDVQTREIFSISAVPFRLGKQFLPNKISMSGGELKSAYMDFMVQGDNDLTCAQYGNLHDADSLQNWVDITEYNPQTKEIKGKFSCNLLIDPEGGNAGVRCKPSDPDIIRIRNGVFHTKIVN